jgi:phage repressor protein C with HTH and peptisase S24 domain
MPVFNLAGKTDRSTDAVRQIFGCDVLNAHAEQYSKRYTEYQCHLLDAINLPIAKIRNMDKTKEIRRINLQKIEQTYDTQAELADRLEIAPAYLNHLLTGHRPIGEKTARKIENRLNLPYLSLDFETAQQVIEIKEKRQEYSFGGFDLWDSHTPLRDDEVKIPFFREVEIAAGSGRTEVIENHGLNLRFAKSTLKKHGVPEHSAACAIVSGNSMEPVMPDGTTIGINKADTVVKDGKIYVIDQEGHLRVKAIYKLPGGGLRLRSYNDDEWPDERYSPDESKAIRIIGRVFWYSALI